MKHIIRATTRLYQDDPLKSTASKLLSIFICACLLLVLIGSTMPTNAADVIYVNNASTCVSGCGGSWAEAYPNLQDALAAASSGGQIWVAEGVYYPDDGTGQTDDDVLTIFTMINGVSIYGGFAGSETLVLEERSPGAGVLDRQGQARAIEPL